MKNRITGHGWLFIATLVLSLAGVLFLTTRVSITSQLDNAQVEQYSPDTFSGSTEQRSLESAPPEKVEEPLEPVSKIEEYTGLINAIKDLGVEWSPILVPIIVWFTQRKKKYIKDPED